MTSIRLSSSRHGAGMLRSVIPVRIVTINPQSPIINHQSSNHQIINHQSSMISHHAVINQS
jgi:hypothetical protein